MGRRILIVDDEVCILRILSFRLRKAGFVPFEARSAEEALELLGRQPVDLLLLDVTLATPTNGFDLAAMLRKDERLAGLPIFLLTASGSTEDILRGREVGAVGYVTKPFSIDDLIGRIQTLLAA